MRFRIVSLLIFACAIFSWAAANAASPSSCELESFLSRERPLSRLVYRGHAFQLGRVTLVGLGIGFSQTDEVTALAEDLTRDASPTNGFQTWYFSRQRRSAAARFNHFVLHSPKAGKFVADGREALVDEFDASFSRMVLEGPHSIPEIAKNSGYLAVGCDSQKHRGPTVFGMLLAFSGCTPEQSATIVNTVWSLNKVPADLRLEIIQRAFDLGVKNPDVREVLQQAFTARPSLRVPCASCVSPSGDRALYDRVLKNLQKEPIRSSKWENFGLKIYRKLVYDQRRERAASFTDLLADAKRGTPYAQAVQRSLDYWNGKMAGAIEQNAVVYQDAYFKERLELAKFYLKN